MGDHGRAVAGRTELERLVDIDSSVQLVGEDVFVVGFQGRAAMLALDSGQIWWARAMPRAIAGWWSSADAVYITAADGDVIALNRRDGTPLWKQAALHRRGLSGPRSTARRSSSRTSRVTCTGSTPQPAICWHAPRRTAVRVTNRPLVVDGLVVVLTDGGRLSAFRREPPKDQERRGLRADR